MTFLNIGMRSDYLFKLICPVDNRFYVAIEAGKYLPSLELAFRIAAAFNVSVGDVFSYEIE
jgi:putative transcriptional regulator